jgi:hypothetical protein
VSGSDRPGRMVTVVYTGPPHQQCRELADVAGAEGLLEPGASYSVPAEFAERLLASSAHFELAKAKPAARKRKPISRSAKTAAESDETATEDAAGAQETQEA